MIQPFEAEGAAERALVVRIRADRLLFLALMVAVVGVRIANLRYNSLFVDEAIYATVGRNFLAGALDSSPLTWMYGSLLYPSLMAGVDSLTGEAGLRLVSVMLSSLATWAVYAATVRLFDGAAAVWATLFFGLTAISIDMGQYAVYDAPVIPVLALCLYLLVRASETPGGERRLLQLAALLFILGFLSKYFAALYLPALVCVGALCALRQGRSLRTVLLTFLTPAVLTLLAYGWLNLGDLRLLLAGDYGVSGGARAAIFADIWAEIGVTSLIAFGGLGLLVWRGLPGLGAQPLGRRLLWSFLVILLLPSLFAAPLYHLLAANQHAAWKHTVFSLIFLAPLAGYACSSLVTALRSLPGRSGLVAGVIGALASAAIVSWGLDYAFDRNWGFQHSWPNVTRLVAHLRANELTPGAPVLAEGAPIYEYYLNPGPQYRDMWTSTWYVRYGDRAGIEAMEAAIADRYYQAVILDSYYTPEYRTRLETALAAAGYRPGYTETQPLSLGFAARLAVYYAP